MHINSYIALVKCYHMQYEVESHDNFLINYNIDYRLDTKNNILIIIKTFYMYLKLYA